VVRAFAIAVVEVEVELGCRVVGVLAGDTERHIAGAAVGADLYSVIPWGHDVRTILPQPDAVSPSPTVFLVVDRVRPGRAGTLGVRRLLRRRRLRVIKVLGADAHVGVGGKAGTGVKIDPVIRAIVRQP